MTELRLEPALAGSTSIMLSFAAEEYSSGPLLGTAEVFAALARFDVDGDWERVTLH